MACLKPLKTQEKVGDTWSNSRECTWITEIEVSPPIRNIGNVSLERLQTTSLCTPTIQQSAPSELLALSLADSIALSTTLRMKAVLQLAYTHLLTTKFELGA
jgi:hypothetical protein